MVGRIGRIRGALRVVSTAVFGYCLVKELRLPKERRTWHGTVLGFVPYDLRIPTPARVKEAFWNPSNPHLFTGRPFGIGWAVNFYALWQRLAACTTRQQGHQASATAAAA